MEGDPLLRLARRQRFRRWVFTPLTWHVSVYWWRWRDWVRWRAQGLL